ncbi:hypothetical protein ACU5AY_05975 [Rhizobium sp. PAMB 3174]
MKQIQLSELTKNGEVRNLSGHERGLAARQHFKLEEMDQEAGPVVVLVPRFVYTITPSFFQGMFAESVKRLGDRDKFLAHYSFDAEPVVLQQVESGIRSSLMERKPIFAN